MSSGSPAGSRLSILLVALMILPSTLSMGSLWAESSELAENSEYRGTSEFPNYIPLDLNSLDPDDPSYGWGWDNNNIGTASLAHRSASYVPIKEWTQRTGESTITGWHALGHDYPIPSDWISDLGEKGVECRAFYAPQGLHCYVPKLTPAMLMEEGVIGAFRLSESDKLSVAAIRIVQGFSYKNAIMEGDDYEVNVVLPSSGHFSDILETGLEIRSYEFGRFVKLVASPKEIEMLASQDYVEWVEPSFAPSFDDEVAATSNGAQWVSIPSNMADYGGALTGDGIIVAVMDSGLDTAVECSGIASCTSANSGINQDFHGRIVGVQSYDSECLAGAKPNCGPDDYNGHGTHVAGSVLGDGSNSPGTTPNTGGSGMAPGAFLFMQSVGYGSTDGSLDTPDFSVGFQDAYDAGARVQTNSWGSGPDYCDVFDGRDCELR